MFFLASYSEDFSDKPTLSKLPVWHPDFGKTVDFDNFILDNVAKKKISKLNSVTAEIVMRDLYRTHYGIFDHSVNSNRNPLSSSLLHESERFDYEGKLEGLFKSYLDKQVNELFKMSLLDYLKLPSYMSGIIRKICDSELTKKTSILNNIENSLNKEKK